MPNRDYRLRIKTLNPENTNEFYVQKVCLQNFCFEDFSVIR